MTHTTGKGAVEEGESFGEWLQRVRNLRRQTQPELGELVSYSGAHIRKVEAGERWFAADRARALAKVLDIPEEEREAFVIWAHGGPPPRGLSVPAVVVDTDRSPPAQPPVDTRAEDVQESPSAPRPDTALPPDGRARRALRFWLVAGGILLMLALIAGLTAAKVGQNTPESRIVPGGRWLGPDRNFVAREGAIHLAARAYPARADDPPIAYVNFTVWWAEGDWQVACTARTPQPGTSDQYICDWDPASRAIPNGVIKVSFDVYDARGNHNNAPNGIHEGIVQR